MVSSFTYFLGNSISVSLIVALTRGMSLIQIWLGHFLVAAPSFIIAGLLSLAAIGMVSSTSALLSGAFGTVMVIAYYWSIRSTALSTSVSFQAVPAESHKSK